MVQYWDSVAWAYDFLYSIVGWDERRSVALDGLTGSLLEVCCGTGSLVAMALAQGLDARGIDLSAGMISKAKSKLAESGWDPERVSVADARELPFDDASFDTVVCTGSIGLLPRGDAERAVAEMDRVARFGLRFIEPFRFGDEPILASVSTFLMDGMRLLPMELLTGRGLRIEGSRRGVYGTMSFIAARKQAECTLRASGPELAPPAV